MTWHKIDIHKLFVQLLPVSLRRLHTVLFLHALSLPLKRLTENVLYKMQHDGRVIYLEKVLNEAAEIPTYSAKNHENTKVLFIGPGEIPDEVYIFQNPEPDAPVWLELGDEFPNEADKTYLNTQAELDDEYCDFTVWVPGTMNYLETKLRHLINYYKMAGKKYKFKWL